ncbi:Nrap protein, partial [Xylariomycetidae sp. FL0641]
MEANTAKRRKLQHADGEPIFEAISSATSSMGASGASAFVLETDELLKESRLDYAKAFPNVDDTLRQFKDTLEALQNHGPLPISEATAAFEKANRTAIPYPDPKPSHDAPYKLAFEPPAQVNVVGSYASRTMIRSQANMAVDMIVVMPDSLFQVKDYRDFRYFYKRAYYLANVAAGLRKKLSTMDFAYAELNGNPLLPILVTKPKKSSKAGELECAIRVIPTAPEGFFPVAKLSAASANIRQGASETSDDTKAATPFYNTTLKAESSFTAYLRLLHRTANTCPAFRDAVILGRVWLQQRGLGGDIAAGGFGHFEWAVLMALLLQSGGRKGEAVLSPQLHCTQLFKATLQYLVSSNLHKKPLVLGSETPELEAIRQAGPVLYDSTRGMNLLFKMTPWSANLLVEHAKWSLSATDDNPIEQFDHLFIAKVNQSLQLYDLLVRVNIPSSAKGTDPVDSRGPTWAFCDVLYRTLRKALGERARLININVPRTAQWSTTPGQSRKRPESLLVEISVDLQAASQGRDHGPSYDLKKDCAKFREFWGDKSELWQFPDGRIVESLDWTEYSPLGFAGICEAIIRYILKRRLKLNDKDLEFHVQDSSNVIALLPTDRSAFDSARTAFTIFERDIRDLEDLPLQVRHITPTDAVLRSASIKAPEFNQARSSSPPMEVVMSFEASGKWPENLAAIQRAKIALLLKVGSSLEAHKEEIKSHIGLESADKDSENLAFLDVVYEHGVSFRLRVSSDLEETILDRRTKDKTLERHDRTEASELLASFKKTFTNLPLHTQTIATYCGRFPALSSAIRLTKHWFNCHKLSHHFDEALIELFVLQAFLKPYPFPIPSSGMTGFFRALWLLARYDWREEALVVDHAASLSASQQQEISTRLTAWRKIDPNMNRTVLFVATSHDTSGLAWTQHGPSKVVATRMTALARSAIKAAKDKAVDLDIRTLFQPALRDFDVLLHLNPKTLRAVAKDDGTKHSLFRNLDQRVSRDALPLPEPPAKALLRCLEAAHAGGTLLFFHGGNDDNVIAALWNPQIHARGFTVNMPCSFRPTAREGEKGQKMFEVNREAILAEIARVGGDLIERIETKA